MHKNTICQLCNEVSYVNHIPMYANCLFRFSTLLYSTYLIKIQYNEKIYENMLYASMCCNYFLRMQCEWKKDRM